MKTVLLIALTASALNAGEPLLRLRLSIGDPWGLDPSIEWVVDLLRPPTAEEVADWEEHPVRWWLMRQHEDGSGFARVLDGDFPDDTLVRIGPLTSSTSIMFTSRVIEENPDRYSYPHVIGSSFVAMPTPVFKQWLKEHDRNFYTLNAQ